MPYETFENASNVVVDLRSDTISRPTDEMHKAIAEAVIGDDVFGEDPTVNLLKQKSAALFGKESALFVPSGTMSNLIAILTHCPDRGSEIIVGDQSHVFRFEQGGASQLGGVHVSAVRNLRDGTFDLDEVESRIRKVYEQHEPVTKVIIVENTHNLCGGKIMPKEWIERLYALAQKYDVKLHMDGARVLNVSVATKTPVAEITKYFDSVTFCLSKSLGAPIGSVLVGSKSFIARGQRYRQALGGGMRQAGILAAAGIVALDSMVERLAEDHRHAKQVAQAIDKLKSSTFKVEPETVQTNILIMYLDKTKIKAPEVLKRLALVLEGDDVKVSVKAGSMDESIVRFVFYHNISDEDVKLAIKKICFVIKEFDKKLKSQKRSEI